MPLVSVILPIYRKEPELVRASLESVLGQTLSELEVLAVNDASPDDLGTLLAEYATRDSRLRVLTHETNRGVSAARNTGLDHATGEYVMFLDPDDLLLPWACEALTACAQKFDSEMVLGASRKFYGTPPDCAAEKPNGHEKVYFLPRYTAERAIWKRLYRRTMLDKIRFPEGLNLCEDLVFANAVAGIASRPLEVKILAVLYRQGSVWKRKIVRNLWLKDSLRALELLAEQGKSDPSRRRMMDYLIERRFFRHVSKVRKLTGKVEQLEAWKLCGAFYRRWRPNGLLRGLFEGRKYRSGFSFLFLLIRGLSEATHPLIQWETLRHELYLKQK
ncbi:MAG: glycosyltransferase family 2 protein [Victivallaceae bacterium]|nr:glycosyltransferase family 2 protein [Victivallaceae bacterium]